MASTRKKTASEFNRENLTPELRAICDRLNTDGYYFCGFIPIANHIEIVNGWRIGSFLPCGLEAWHEDIGLFFKEFPDGEDSENVPSGESENQISRLRKLLNLCD